jgi:PAS domain S-box-containing protein
MAAELLATVLIVEDDPGIADLERERLVAAGYAVRLAGTADAALAAVRKGGVDLILLDYRLPGGVDGLEFHAGVCAAGYDIPVILVTGFSNESTVIRALRSGIRDFVTKSLEYLDYLPEAVGRVLRQVETEHRLAESEARLASIFASAKDALIVTDADRRITLFNPAAEAMFRVPTATALGQPITRFIPDDLVETGPAESLTHRLRTGTRGVRATGELFPLEASVARSAAAGRRMYTVVVRDVTERRRAEARIREQAALLDQANDAIMVCGLDDRISFWSRGAERLYGWTAVEAVGGNAHELLYRQPPPVELNTAGRAVVETGEWTGELRQVACRGRDLVVESRWTLLRDDEGRPHANLVINTDITERKQLEEQYLHAQRMESVGTLAGGVAHDFNNLLTVINGYCELLVETAAPDDPSRPILVEVCRAGERAAALTRQLLAFSRKQMFSTRVFDLNGLVRDTGRMLDRLIGERVELQSKLEPSLARVKADPGQIEQVIVNLVVNARDAMPGGGRLTVETANVELDEGYARRHMNVRPGRYVRLAVSDTGVGMDAATQARVFEPFFTTKEVGKGTGLGLATAHGIVSQSGGHIDVRSTPGKGTTFDVFLPVANDEPDPVAGESAFPAARGTETILLVEDEAGVRGLARVALAANGYAVLEAECAEKALTLVGAHTGPLDLLVTDVVMPRMSGRELAEKLLAARPGVKVLYLSGYTEDAVVRYALPAGKSGFLQKPFTPTVLVRKVREVLDG